MYRVSGARLDDLHARDIYLYRNGVRANQR
jgi:hypothetical protein